MTSLRIANHQPCRIAATGAAFPRQFAHGELCELSNEDVIKLMAPRGPRGERGPQEIQLLAETLAETLGVRRRRWAHRVGDDFHQAETSTVDLQTSALEDALSSASMDARDLGAIIATTSTPAKVTSGNAPAVARALGGRCASFDVRAGCAGGVHALVQGAMMVAASGQPVAVVASDTFSKLIPPDQPVAGLALADGAGAVVLTPDSRGAGLAAASLCADGALSHLGTSPSPFPPTRGALEQGLYYLTGDPAELARQAPALYQEAITEALADAGVGSHEVDLFIPHQAGAALISAVAQLVKIPAERVFSNVADHANVGSASVLVALHEALQTSRAEPGQLLLTAALGGGLCWGAAVIRL